MKATFLEASVPLTKTFRLEGKELKKIGHPQIINYTSHEKEYSTLAELKTLLVFHAAKGHCFLKGNLGRLLLDESRAGATDPNAPTRILLLDLDGIKGITHPDELLGQLGLSGCSYIVQYSSSMGVDPGRGMSAHIFIFLDKPYAPAILKQWLIGKNLELPLLRKSLTLARTNNTLRWPLDITTCQNDKLIYIAPPILGEGVVDGFVGERIQLFDRGREETALPGITPTMEANRSGAEVALNELRAAAGLPKRTRAAYKSAGNIEYFAKPDQATVTGVRTDRGFTYLNLNGGDSWGYYHPETNPEFIFNFKNEPNYKTSELVPDYWAEVRKLRTEVRPDASGRTFLAFRDFRTAAYWNGVFADGVLNLAPAKSETQLRHFLMQHGQPVGDFVPDWTVRFSPNSDFVVDPKTKQVNLFQPSAYMRMQPVPEAKVPRTIRRVILHALGGDEEAFEHFMNWLAVILQYRCRTMTAWVWHGIQGTGKGLVLNYILSPIFGPQYVVTKRMEELESQFNGYMEQCFILMIDEAQLSEFKRSGVINASLKNYIVEPMISVRRMYSLPYMADNFLNLVFASNMPAPVIIDPLDRRFNVARFQDQPLILEAGEFERIEEELLEFYSYLMTREASKDKARTPLNNSAKAKMVYLSQTAIDVACQALIDGNTEFFESQKPGISLDMLPRHQFECANAFVELLKKIEEGKAEVLLREEIRVLLEYAVGGMPESPHKLSSLLKHHKIHIEPVTRDGKTFRGIKVPWTKISSVDGLKP